MILTPHIAAFTVQGQRRVVASVCSDVAAVLRGESPRYVVNPLRGGLVLPRGALVAKFGLFEAVVARCSALINIEAEQLRRRCLDV